MSGRSRSTALGRRAARGALAIAAAGVCLLAITGTVWAAFSDEAANHGNEIVAAPDFTAPSATQATIQKAQGGTPGFIRPGGSFHVYANVTDTGNPASGVATVRADVSSVNVGGTAVALSPGNHTVGGVSYNYRSQALTARTPLVSGTHGFSLSLADQAGNTRTQGGFTVTVDGLAPTASDVQTQNRAGGFAGQAETGDTMTLTYSELVEPGTISAGWNGSDPLPVVVRLEDNVAAHGGLDTVTVYNAQNSATLPLGTVRLGRSDYTNNLRTYGATGTPSTLVQAGNGYVVTLGTASGTARTASSGGTMTWVPATAPTDRAGNGVAAASVNESGGSDREF